MKRRLLHTFVLLGLFLAATGCLSTKSYVDPTLPKVTQGELSMRNGPKAVHLKVEFRRNGEALVQVSNTVYDEMSAILRSSGLFTSVVSADLPDSERVTIVLDNVGDLGKAVTKGVGTGLTFGLVGSAVTDGYVFTGTFEDPEGKVVTKEYQHAIHSTIGNKRGPSGLQPMSTQQAFDTVCSDLLYKFLKDLQEEGYL